MILLNVRETAKRLLRPALITAMVLCLAFTAQHSLSFLATSPTPTPGSFQVQAQDAELGIRQATKSELKLETLIVNGRRLPFESTERSPQWTTSEVGGRRVISLVRNGASPPGGSVTFTGAQFLLTARARMWSGMLEAQRDNQVVQSVSVEETPGPGRDVIMEDPPAALSHTVLVAALVLFTLAAWIFAPWRGNRRTDFWLLFFLVTFHVIFWATQCVATTRDSPSYRNSLQEIMRGIPTYFPPGYPAFLGLVQFLSIENHGRYVALVQHVLAVLAALWTYSIAKRLATVELALLAGILAGTLSPITTMSQTVMTEIPTLFAMVGALYFGMRSAETGKYRFAILAGILTGWGGLLRAVPLVAVLPAIVLLLWFSGGHRKICLAAIVFGVAGTVVLLPVVWFGCKAGKPTIANSAGRHLYNRVVFEQKQLDENGSATRTLLTILDGEDPRPYPFWKLLKRPGFNQLPPRERGANKAERLLLDVAREGIRKDPLEFVSHTLRLAWREFEFGAANSAPLCGDSGTLEPELESPPPLRLTASGLQWRWQFDKVQHTVWPLLRWAAIIGALGGGLLSNRGLVLALAWVPFGYLVSTASLDMFMARHCVPTIPFVAALATVPLHVLLVGWSETDSPSSRLNDLGVPDCEN